jgi:diguanylate cyclase (GGDEF)-like protein/hemerythrin-like metal-binding protein
MQTFAWDQNFVTGLASVDEQHRQLVHLINRLGESLINGRETDQGTLQALFEQLAEYARYHFEDEERLMREANIAPEHFELHRRSHQGFIDQVSTMWNSRGSMTNPAEVLHGFLMAWLGFHILGEDQVMARQIARIRAGESPAEAYAMDAASKDHATAALLRALRNLYLVLSEQNRDLADATLRLAQRVAERTRELSQANQALSDANRQLERISRTDGLLEIANRRYFDERLDEEWHRAAREHKPLALLLIDVDYFKRYNDTYGHQAGDRCLQAVAGAARSVLSRPGDLLARYGGEELGILLPNTETNGANAVALNVCAKVAALQIPHSASAVVAYITVSVGVAAMAPERQASSDQLVFAADRALYSAKENGRNRVCSA